MPDEYWLIIKGPRFKILPWFKKTSYFNKYCEYRDMSDFVDKLRSEHPGYKINIGITRGTDIYVLS